MKYLNRLGTSPALSRPEVKAFLEGKGSEAPSGATALEGPELRGHAGRPAPKHGGPGLGVAAARQTLGDLFSAAEAVGVGPGMVARLAPVFEGLLRPLEQLGKSIEKAEAKYGAELGRDFRALTARVVEAAATGFGATSTESAQAVLRTLFTNIGRAVDQADGRALSPAGVAAAASVMRLLAELKPARLDEHTEAVAASVAWAELSPMQLSALVSGLAEAHPKLVGLADSARLFEAGVALAVFGLEKADSALDNKLGAIAKELGLAKGEQAVVLEIAETARKSFAAASGQQAGAGAEAEAIEKRLEGKQGPVSKLVEDAKALEPSARQAFLQQVEAQLGASDTMRVAHAGLHLSMLASAADTPAAVLADASAVLTRLAQRPEIGEEGARELSLRHAERTPATEVAATLNTLAGVLDAMPEATRQRLAQAEPLADGTPPLASVANAIRGFTERFQGANGPKGLVAEVLAKAETAPQLAQALRFGVRAALATPDTENGPARDLLRQNLAADLAAMADAGIPYGAMVAGFSKVPADSVARFSAIALSKKEDPDTWLGELEKLFKACRGNKNHIRSLRGLIAAIDAQGADAIGFTRALLAAKLNGPVLTKTVDAMLGETANQPSPEYVSDAIAALGKGESLLTQINNRTSEAMMERLGLRALLEGGEVTVTQTGLKEVEGPLQAMFKGGAGRAEVNQDILKGLLVATLEGRSDAYRFETPKADAQLQSLSAEQRKLWEAPRAMTHIRLEDEAKAKFLERVGHAAKVSGALLERMTEAWGEIPALEQTLSETTAQLRDLKKDDVAARKKLTQKVDGLPRRLEALRWAQAVASFDADNVTPEGFLDKASYLDKMFRAVSPGGEAAVRELMWTMRLGDVDYTEVVSNDAPELSDIYKVSTTNCLSFPGYGGEVLAYAVDANKRMVMTQNAAGEPRRAVLRIVERQDEGFAGQPMLLLERTYPDTVSHEEKQRLVEHAMRRAEEMGISCAFATEYYWDASKTQRANIIDMNAVIDDLAKRYGYDSEVKVSVVKNRSSNMNVEYLDSAPLPNADARGRAGYRGFPNRHTAGWEQQIGQDKDFDNEFVIMTPKG